MKESIILNKLKIIKYKDDNIKLWMRMNNEKKYVVVIIFWFKFEKIK